MADSDNADLFAIPDFWKLSTWQQQPPPLAAEERRNGFFSLDVEGNENVTFFLGKGEPEAVPGSDDDGSLFKIPSLLSQLQPSIPQITDNALNEESKEDHEMPAEPSTPPTPDVDDFWLFPDHEAAPPPLPEFKTWAAFEHSDISNATCVLGTEQGPKFVDALVEASDSLVLHSVEKDCLDCGNNSRYLRAFIDHTYTAAASANTPSRVALARGVDSLLLTIQSELGTRGQKANSLLQLQALVQPVASLVKFIRGLVTKLSRSVISTGASEERFLTMLYQEAQSMEYSVVFMRDVIKQLLQLVSEPWLDFVGEWIGLGHNSKATLWTGDFKSKGFVRPGDRVWVDDMGTELAESDYLYDDERMPAFIPKEMAKDIFETGRNLRFLWTNHPEHPLSDPTTVPFAGPPPLAWQFDWESIHALDHKAFAYEKTLAQSLAWKKQKPALAAPLLNSVLPGSIPISWRLPTIDFQFFGKNEDQIELSMQSSMAKLSGPLPCPSEDGLATVLRRQLFNGGESGTSDMAALDEFAPHWSLLPLLSFGPVIAAQSRLISRECMRLLFGVHNVREHLKLQREFQLLGNGVFCSRLSHALFDPDLPGAEQGTGVQLSSVSLGLRLSRRNNENWPPASSELRLALMGVLAESYYQGKKGGGRETAAIGKQELPGGMSFAIRDLSIDEMDKCMDPDSLEAMDFLRLSYKPPSALMSVITPGILSKYDRVFMLLLRVLRMYYVVNQLFENDLHSRSRNRTSPPHQARAKPYGAHADNLTTRFLIESRHFVANIMAYFLDTGVDMPWQRFETWLDTVHKDLDNDETANEIGSAGARGRADQAGPDKLCERHEQTLDEIMLALLLRKRQQPLLVLLQSIFGLILEFAKSARELTRAMMIEDNEEEEQEVRRMHQERTKRLYASFRKKVAAFLAVCRGLSEKEADSVARKDYQQQQQYQDGSRAGEGNSLSRLLLMLDYNGSYSSSSASRGW
ncbi:hypothetical protein SBRCBS47491_008092 [Sporothrix bragantina]|uniref:Spindle pole body component n=1 Tax=Sporothrix bragantina TaxID=671064 RepID=A0ABP0CIN3_9PEZI